ncbi:DciA family protein [Ramlibacter sp. H39-3-26]|uniref:DciA family protein n=1 Tax=Curvibacter soli TaxID=3031331 RepID=UPI0023DB226F|nr:DciA family protein [Ramlibacter sp. H39-3-26]MDF1485476.1 DciA family protein [Ramlibacter sp. H39-3-26]
MNRTRSPVTLIQASQASPALARLTELVRDSNSRLQSVQPLVPRGLHQAIQAGPIEGNTWCLLVSNAAAAAKLRQLLPTLEAHLRSRGWEVNAIRIKVQSKKPHRSDV